MTKASSLEEVLELADQLTAADQLRLIERLAPRIARGLHSTAPRRSLRGILKGVEVTDEDIRQMRHEAWRSFPPDDAS